MLCEYSTVWVFRIIFATRGQYPTFHHSAGLRAGWWNAEYEQNLKRRSRVHRRVAMFSWDLLSGFKKIKGHVALV
jgi:hypothetical protein